MFISDKFKLNNNRFIKILQKLVFTNIILALFSLIGYLLDVSIFNTLFFEGGDVIEVAANAAPNSPSSSTEVQASQSNTEKDVIRITSNMGDKDEEYYNFKIKKDLIADVWEKGKSLVATSATDIAPNIGVGAAVGKIGSEIIKQTAGMAPGQRLALVGSSALVTAVGVKVGLGLGEYLTENKIQEWEGPSKLNTGDRSNSPTNFDGGSSPIHSFLDANENVIPLVGMVTGLCYLNYIELILILNLFSLLFRKYLFSKLIEFILSLNLKIIKNNNNKILSFKNSMNSVDKYANFVVGFIFLCLFFIKIMNLYFSSHLVADIDSFVNVYNHIKNNSFSGLLFTFNLKYCAQASPAQQKWVGTLLKKYKDKIYLSL
jgi:hypothetical protein